MPVEIVGGTPLAEQLQGVVQHKLIELGWSSGGLDDSALAEYIVLMVAGGKTAQEVATELSNDFLADSSGAPEFAQWLFQQVDILGGGAQVDAQSVPPTQAEGAQSDDTQMKMEDANMEDLHTTTTTTTATTTDTPADDSIPTGPKSMRTRDKRFLGQMNKALDRSGDNKVLHRIKGAAGGVGRINAHGTPRGPAAAKGQTPKGPRATMNRLANAPMAPQHSGMPNHPGTNGANNPFANMTPHQQMQLMAMYEQQAQMMAQIFNPANAGGPSISANPLQSGKSLFERVNKGSTRGGGSSKGPTGRENTNSTSLDMESSMEVEPGSQNVPNADHDTTMCRFNLTCGKPDCYFVHQSPAAPAGTVVDMTDTCSFGAACKNRKCTGKHPSPAKLAPQRAEQECRFYPNCTNIACPFRHPTMPPCRNGADCTTAGCKFFHAKVECRFDPCLNAACPYKHRDGQKRGSYQDKVWVNSEGENKQHTTSDRKFVDEMGEEELIVPVKAVEGIVT